MNKMPSDRIAKNGGGSPLDNCEERIRQLHGSLTLEQLKETIDKELGKKISKSQYRLKFKQLGLSKHPFKRHEIHMLSAILAQMPRGSQLCLWGRPLPQADVGRIRSRGRPSIFAQIGPHELPRGYTIRPAPSEQVDHSTAGLPFLDFIHAWRTVSEDPTWQRLREVRGVSPRLFQNGDNTEAAGAECLVQEAWNLTPFSLAGIQALGNTFFANNPRALAVLGIVPPLSVISDCVSIGAANNDSRTVNLLLGRQLLFSVANGFAGIDGFPICQVFKLLQGITIPALIQLFRVAQGPTMQAITQILFKAFIESDNHTILGMVLSCEAVHIDVNKEKIFVDGRAYTPVERASILRHHETIRVLICHGADLNKTYDDSSEAPHGALECAVDGYRGPNDETFELLTKVVPTISAKVVAELLSNERCFIHLIRHHSQKCRSFDGVFPSHYEVARIVGKFSEQSIIDILGELGNIEVSQNLLNEAASRGHVKLYEKLVSEYGLHPDDDTLSASIQGGDTHLVQSLLSCGSSIHRLAEPKGLTIVPPTPLAVAIKEGNEEIINLLRRYGAFSSFPCWDAFLAAWDAAKEAQNKELLDQMMKITPGAADSYGSRNCAFEIACRTGNFQVAKELLDQVAFTTTREGLKIAIQSQQPDLIDLILDYDSLIGSEELTLATKLGNHLVVRTLLAEGARPERETLRAALRLEDKKLADLILDAGVDINEGEGNPHSFTGSRTSALQVTAELGNQDLVQYVLKKGADPYDPKALNIAYQTSPGVLKTILTAYKERYNRRMEYFGSMILASAVRSRDLTLVRMLLDHNVDAHGFVEQMQPSKGHDPDFTESMLWENNTDMNGFIEHGRRALTPFGYAILIDNSNDLSMVSEFLKYCHPRDMVSRGVESEMTAFLTAIESGNVELVRRLVKEDEEIIHAPARRRAKRTALQWASEIGSLEMVKLLHNLGAKVDEPPNRDSGATALQLAAIEGFGQILNYLLDHGADVNARGAVRNGMTALVGAASRGRIDIVAMLLNRGAGRGEYGREQFERALSEAEEYGHYPTYDYLMDVLNAQEQEGSLQDLSMGEFVDLDAFVEE